LGKKAKFGFFDLDTIFSAGFIMLLAAIIESANNEDQQIPLLRPGPGISEAIQLLDYLGSFNNQAAIQRRDQIQKLYDRIPSLMSQSRSSEGPTSNDGSLQMRLSAQTLSGPIYSVGNNTDESQVTQTFDFMGNAGMEGCTVGSLPIEFPDDPQAMYSLYHPEDFTLTGGDIADFEELQRHLFGNDG
jgi:proline utilization trans-activator